MVKIMGKGAIVLGLIGLLIGAGGLTFGIIAWSTINTEMNINNSWYDENNGPFSITPPFTVLEIPNLNVTFDLNRPASVYLSFTCHALITAASGYSTAFFYFAIDGVLLTSPSNRVGTFQGGSTNDYYSVTLQHLIEVMAAGSHNITVRVSTDNTGNVLTYMTLYVHTFTP
jgi:hypothetical protein